MTAALRAEAPAPAVASERLRRLRAALLDAPYSLCTSTAELLTQYFQETAAPAPWLEVLTRTHFTVTRRALERNLGEGAPQPRWQLELNRGLQRLYARAEDRDPTPVVIRYARAMKDDLIARTLHDAGRPVCQVPQR